MKVFVTGARGLVGAYLCPQLGDAQVVATDLPEVDITSPGSLRAALGPLRPDWIVNLAAFTDVDGAESAPGKADACNGEGAGNVARLARDAGARMLQVSTDYVFDGRSPAPRAEDAPANPISAYGRSKLRGELAVKEVLPEGSRVIVRGQSLYGKGRKSFPDAILAAAERKPEVPVVTDQTVQPTWARDFAEALVALIRKDARGVVHVASSGSCTWNEFARAVLEEAGRAPSKITGTTAAALARPAPRPAHSVFDLGRFERLTGIRPRPWRDQLRDYLRSTGRAA